MCDSSYRAICAIAPFTKHPRIEKRERERKTNHDESIQSDNCIRNRADHSSTAHTIHAVCSRACVNMQETTRAKIKINERQFVDRDGAGFVRRFNFCCCCVSLFVSYLEFYFYFYKSNICFYSSKLFC